MEIDATLIDQVWLDNFFGVLSQIKQKSELMLVHSQVNDNLQVIFHASSLDSPVVVQDLGTHQAVKHWNLVQLFEELVPVDTLGQTS